MPSSSRSTRMWCASSSPSVTVSPTEKGSVVTKSRAAFYATGRTDFFERHRPPLPFRIFIDHAPLGRTIGCKYGEHLFALLVEDAAQDGDSIARQRAANQRQQFGEHRRDNIREDHPHRCQQRQKNRRIAADHTNVLRDSIPRDILFGV